MGTKRPKQEVQCLTLIMSDICKTDLQELRVPSNPSIQDNLQVLTPRQVLRHGSMVVFRGVVTSLLHFPQQVQGELQRFPSQHECPSFEALYLSRSILRALSCWRRHLISSCRVANVGQLRAERWQVETADWTDQTLPSWRHSVWADAPRISISNMTLPVA